MQATGEANRQSAVVEAAKRAKRAARGLARMTAAEKNGALQSIAAALGENADAILQANAKDLDAARPLVESGQMAPSLFARLKLDRKKIQGLVAGVEQVASLDDPVGRIDYDIELDAGLDLARVACPIGVVGVIFESRPDALSQIASLGLKSGNAVLLKGGKEAEHSNRAIFDVLARAATHAGVPEGALALLETRADVAELLGADRYVDLIVPRGSNALVRHIQQNTAIPVLGHAEGICHIYVDRAADLDKALDIVVDAKTHYPAACNAAETLLVHAATAADFLPRLSTTLRERGVVLRADARARKGFGIDADPATAEDWDTEYCDLILSIRIVDGLDEAIDHINEHGSGHTDAIVTEDDAAWDRFFADVDSAGVYRNASTRFADGFRYGFGAEVGISTGKLHPRGPVGLEGLVTYKYRLVGHGQTVAEYADSNGKKFLHRRR